MVKSLVLALVAATATLGAGVAQARVAWAIDINAPVVGAVISNAPVYAPRRFYAPVPVYAAAPPVAYDAQPDVYYRLVPEGYPHYRAGWRHDHDRDRGHDRREGRGWR